MQKFNEYKTEDVRIAEQAKDGGIICYSSYNALLDDENELSEYQLIKLKYIALRTHYRSDNVYKIKIGNIKEKILKQSLPSIFDGIKNIDDLEDALYIEVALSAHGDKHNRRILHSIFPSEGFLEDCFLSLTKNNKFELALALEKMLQTIKSMRNALRNTTHKYLDVSEIYIRNRHDHISGRLIPIINIEVPAKNLRDFMSNYYEDHAKKGNPVVYYRHKVFSSEKDIENNEGEIIVQADQPFIFASTEDDLTVTSYSNSFEAERFPKLIPDSIMVIKLETQKLSLRRISYLHAKYLAVDFDIEAIFGTGKELENALRNHINAHLDVTIDVNLSEEQIEDISDFLTGHYKRRVWEENVRIDNYFEARVFLEYFVSLSEKSKDAFEDAMKYSTEYKYGFPIKYKIDDYVPDIHYNGEDMDEYMPGIKSPLGIYPVRSALQELETSNYVFLERIGHPAIVLQKYIFDLIEQKVMEMA